MPNTGHYIQMISAWADSEYASRAFRLSPGRGCLVLTAFAIDGPPVLLGDRNVSLQEARAHPAAFEAFERANPDFIASLEQQELDRHGTECAARPGLRALFYTVNSLGAEPLLCFRLVCVNPFSLACGGPINGNLDELRQTYSEAWAAYLDRHGGNDPCAPQVREPTPIGNETRDELSQRKPRGGPLSMQDEIKRNLALHQQRLGALAHRR